jgi:hypothetical protein
MTPGEEFARRWIDAWNSLELPRALALWDDDMEFSSPLAAEITGSAVLRGKPAVAAYWRTALERAGDLRFELRQALWDPAARTVTIVYRRRRANEVRIAAEIIRLNEQGLGVSGIALHGAPLTDG